MTLLFAGGISSLSPYLRTVCPRKLKPYYLDQNLLREGPPVPRKPTVTYGNSPAERFSAPSARGPSPHLLRWQEAGDCGGACRSKIRLREGLPQRRRMRESGPRP